MGYACQYFAANYQTHIFHHEYFIDKAITLKVFYTKLSGKSAFVIILHVRCII